MAFWKGLESIYRSSFTDCAGTLMAAYTCETWMTTVRVVQEMTVIKTTAASFTT